MTECELPTLLLTCEIMQRSLLQTEILILITSYGHGCRTKGNKCNTLQDKIKFANLIVYFPPPPESHKTPPGDDHQLHAKTPLFFKLTLGLVSLLPFIEQAYCVLVY